jgi:hypothetical protein
MTAPLPTEATDTGDRIVVSPDRATRVRVTLGAAVGLVIGVLLIVLGEGAVMPIAGTAALLAGGYLLVVQAQRLEFDGEAVHRRSLLRPRTVPWSEVTGAEVAERYVRTHAGGSARRLGGLTVSGGFGGGRRGGGWRRDQAFVVLTVQHDDGDLSMELNSSEVAQAEALFDRLGERGWLPDDVPVTVDAAR